MSEFSERIARLSPKRLALLALELQGQIDDAERKKKEPVAVIGLGCRFPGGGDGQSFWHILREGIDAISEIPPERWDTGSLYDPDPDAPGKISSRYGGFITGIDQFDPVLFGISPREAASMDPQQRLLLEVTWEALEYAAQAPSGLSGSLTGVFMGISTSDYSRLSRDPALIDAYTSTGNAFSVATGRLSYLLGLHGPSIAVDTACSSSLVAVHLACQSLRGRECDMALAGGVNLILCPTAMIALSKLRMMAPDGRCKTFDAAADGFVRGEGCGVVVLKRLSDALRDGDSILALIRGSAVNQDGRSGGLTAPNGPAQEAVIRTALANAAVPPADVRYVEAHGTGTSLGDPIEVQALAAVLAEGRPGDDPVLVGSVKTNLGHLEAAAGIAGLIKIVLSLVHGEIPPHLHFHTPNPFIPWQQIPIAVPTRLTPWPRGSRPRIAGVSSFGFSGTNAHVVLEEAPVHQLAPAHCDRPLHLLTLSARSDAPLAELAARYRDHLAAHPDLNLPDLCYTANTGRSHFSRRLPLVADSTADLARKLAAYAAQPCAGPETLDAPRIAFFFTGQGSQYAAMGRELFQAQPVFRDALLRCDQALRNELDPGLLSVLHGPRTDLLDQTQFTQPALFALQFALAELWRSWGITPAALLGHSVGEYTAACIAGVFSLEDACRLVARRARLMQSVSTPGAMLAVLADYQNVAAVLARRPDALSVAALNGPANTVISGDLDAVDAAARMFASLGIKTHRLTVSHAFHSHLMDPILEPLQQALALFPLSPPKLPVISNLTGLPLTPDQATSPSYWRRHTRETVRFSDGVRSLAHHGCNVFLEIGPAPVLLALARRCHDAGLFLPSLRPGRPEWNQILDSLGQLWASGVDIDWKGFDSPYPRRKMSLPTYPFQRRRYWIEQKQPPQPVPQLPADTTHQDLYRIEWPTKQITTRSELTGSRWLVLADRGGVGMALARVLETSGASATTLFAHELDALDQVLRRETAAGLRGIVYLWALDIPAGLDCALLPDAQSLSADALLQALRPVLTSPAMSSPPRIWLATRGAQPADDQNAPLAVMQAPLLGLASVLALEHPDLWGGIIDLDPVPSPADADNLRAELSQPDGEDRVAYRSALRHVARLVPLHMPLTQPFPIRPDAAYLITGGLGTLGLLVARWLTRQGARHLVLTGRSAVVSSDAQRTTLDEIRQLGASVDILSADAAEPEHMTRVADAIRAAGRPLAGVVHAAGMALNSELARVQPDQLRAVMRPKVLGAAVVLDTLQTLHPDFFVLFSSISSVWGSKGLGAYAAANAFLDALAHHARRAGINALSINWGPWAGSSMLSQQDQAWLSRIGVLPLPSDDALALLGALLASSSSQAVAARVHWDTFLPVFCAHAPRPLMQQLQPPAPLPATPDTPLSPFLELLRQAPDSRKRQLLARHVEDAVRNILALDPAQNLDPRQGFFDMGMDSLMAVELKNKLQADLGHPLPSTLTFDFPKIGALVEYLATAVLPSGSVVQTHEEQVTQSPEVDKVLTTVEQLSEEEALRALLGPE